MGFGIDDDYAKLHRENDGAEAFLTLPQCFLGCPDSEKRVNPCDKFVFTNGADNISVSKSPVESVHLIPL